MSKETRDALLYSQLQESLSQDIMNGPAVSGASSYLELCIAAKNEERRITGLKKGRGTGRPVLSLVLLRNPARVVQSLLGSCVGCHNHQVPHHQVACTERREDVTSVMWLAI